jgi:hypothetical protein
MKKLLALACIALTLFGSAAQAQFFTTFIAISGTPGPSYATWPAGLTGSNLTISNAGRTVSANTVSAWGTSQVSKYFSQKEYYEVTINNVGGNIYIGIEVEAGVTNLPFNGTGRTYAFAWLNTGGIWDGSGELVSGIGSFTSGDVLMFAIDPANKQGWYGKNGTWYNSGNPATGTNPTFTTINASFQYSFGATVSIYGGSGPSGQVTLNAGQAAFSYTVPTGFQAGIY